MSDMTLDAGDPFGDDPSTPKRRRRRVNPLTPRELVGRNVRRRRDQLGWSQQKLSDAMTERGHPIPRPSISELETGDRGVDVTDLLMLGSVLGVSPTSLLLPDGEEYVYISTERIDKAWDDEVWSAADFAGWLSDGTARPEKVIREMVTRALTPILDATKAAHAEIGYSLGVRWADFEDRGAR